MRIARVALLVALALSAPAGAAGQAPRPEPAMDRLRAYYLAAVSDPAAIDRGMAEIERIRAAGVEPGGWADGTLTAYRGALVTLRARHALWPPTKLGHLREGLAVLDRLLAERPDHAEARYLRLMSCYYLPGILGRGWSVREDFAALARLLPDVRERYPAPLFATIARFVLAHGELGAVERRPLEKALAEDDA